jgi:hypothetical protein
MVTVRVSTVDRFSKTGKFKTLAGAQRFAQKWIGEAPDISFQWRYAVSNDGIAKATVFGDIDGKPVSVFDVFPKSDRPEEENEVRMAY